MKLVLAVALVVTVALATASPASEMGIDISDPSFKNLFPEQFDGSVTPSNADDVITFEQFYDNYFQKRGTVTIDAREFADALIIVYDSYIVPSSVFNFHKNTFPATRNYIIYGPIEKCRIVRDILVNERKAQLALMIDLPVGTPLRSMWKGPVQEKKAPYYETISVDDMYGRYTGGSPQSRDPILVDVRTRSEYETKRIKYAVNVPYANLKDSFNTLPVTQKVYLYGMNSTLAIHAAELFAQHYRTYTMPILGGLEEWARKGYPTDSNNAVIDNNDAAADADAASYSHYRSHSHNEISFHETHRHLLTRN